MSNNDLTLRYRSFNQMRYFTVKEEKTFEQKRLEIKNELETIDKEFRESSERKKKGYQIKGYVTRKFKSIFGDISFRRTKYQYYDSETKETKTICLIDNYIGLERYQRLCLHLKLEVLSELGTGKRQRDIVDQFKHANLTRASISHLARTVDVKDLSKESVYEDYKIPENIDKKQYIYLNVDDTYTSLRNSDKEKRDFRIRLITTHLGYVNPNLKRKELLHKRGFAEVSQIPVGSSGTPINKLSTKMRDLLTTFYGNIENKQIIVNGDGAPWIKEFALNIGAEFVLDKYHLASLLYKCFPHDRKKKGKVKCKAKQAAREINKNIYDKCSVFIAKGDSTGLSDYLKTIYNTNVVPNKQDKIKELIGYVINNEKGINNYKQEWYIGSQTEAMISHTVKSIKGYGAKIYNEKTFRNLLNLRLASTNQLEPWAAYQTRALEEIEKKKAYYAENFWRIGTNNNLESIEYVPPQGEILALKGKSTRLGNTLKSIVSN